MGGDGGCADGESRERNAGTRTVNKTDQALPREGSSVWASSYRGEEKKTSYPAKTGSAYLKKARSRVG
jgi:hypothetical protein